MSTQLPGSGRAWRDATLTAYERMAVALHDRFRRRPVPTASELKAGSSGTGAEDVIRWLMDAAAIADRQLSALLTASAFLVALAGAPIATAQAKPGLYAPAAFLALAAFLVALRGLTRWAGGIPGLPPTWRDVPAARDGLAAKAAWGWVAARLLRLSAIWLLVLTVVLSAL